MHVLTARQLRALDEQTLYEEKITSFELMQRAAGAFVRAFTEKFRPGAGPVLVLAGTGNNGGDGFVIAQSLKTLGYKVQLLACHIGRSSPDNIHAKQLAKQSLISDREQTDGMPFPDLVPGVILVDALFGTGLNRPLEGYWAEFVDHLNHAKGILRVAVDLPSGMIADGPTDGIAFRADQTYTLGAPKMAMFAAENSDHFGKTHIVQFQLAPVDRVLHLRKADTAGPTNYLLEDEVKGLLKQRRTYDHKGTFGHALLVAGSFGKMGAAVIAGRGVLRAGAGLLTCHVPRSGYEIMQISFPEAMCTIDPHRYMTTEIKDLDRYRTIGIGPGLGTEKMTARAFRSLLQHYDKPMVVDADALNIIAKEPELLNMVPKGSILTPHPKEFERLFGETSDSFARWRVQSEVARSHGLIVLCKTAYTSIATPDGKIYINSTGNPGMGTAGTGDALTGILTGLLAQGYEPTNAARLGVYLHGLAGDLAAKELGQEFLLAEDVINFIGKAYGALRN